MFVWMDNLWCVATKKTFCVNVCILKKNRPFSVGWCVLVWPVLLSVHTQVPLLFVSPQLSV